MADDSQVRELDTGKPMERFARDWHCLGLVADFSDGAWSPWAWNKLLIEGSHCREIVDNNVDMAHFFYIHRAYPTYFKNVIDGRTATQFMDSKPRPDATANFENLWEETKLRSEATYFGPAFMINWLRSDVAPDFTIEVALINCHFPDVRFWQHKARIDNPLLTEEDGAVYQDRRWYEQFYVDLAEVTPDMTDRFELGVDTTHANAFWQHEIAENIGRADESAGAATSGADVL